MHEAIAIGEIWAGLSYVLAGAGLIILDAVNNVPARSVVKMIAGVLLIVAGLEELADAVVTEGAGSFAVWVQGICTFSQVAVNTLACRVIYIAVRHYR
jgi:sulfite exporter TauE/SafE